MGVWTPPPDRPVDHRAVAVRPGIVFCHFMDDYKGGNQEVMVDMPEPGCEPGWIETHGNVRLEGLSLRRNAAGVLAVRGAYDGRGVTLRERVRLAACLVFSRG